MIKGKLVGLRAVEREDLKIMRDWRNNSKFRKNFREYRELNMEMQNKWFDKFVVENDNTLMFIIVRLKDSKPIGVCGLIYINWLIKSADISFYVGEKNAYIDSLGYGDEALNLLMKYAFDQLNMHKLWTELYEFDTKKINFYEKYKFKRDAVLRDNCFEDGRYWNSYIYSLIQDEFFRNNRG